MFTGVEYVSVPATIVAVVIVMQRIEGCSDREAACRSATTPGAGQRAAVQDRPEGMATALR
jgi:hypothetical protein